MAPEDTPGDRWAEAVLGSVSAGLMVVDRAGCVLFVNPAGERILRTVQGDIRGRRYQEVFRVVGNRDLLVPAPTRPAPVRQRVAVKVRGLEIPLGITVSFVEPAAAAAIDGPLAPPAAVFLFRDLTDVEGREEEARDADRLATIGAVAAAVAHGLRNPLAGIRAIAQLILAELPAPSTTRDDVADIIREVDRADRLIGDILNFARPLRTTRSVEDVGELLRHLLDGQAPLLQEQGIRLHLDLQPLPSLMVARAELELALGDLLRNALEAMPEGGTLSVRAALDQAVFGGGNEERLVIELTDTGAGIKKENLPRIFDPFFTTKSRGSGLGLATCRRIVERHGGRISVASSPGAGTSIRLRLPVVRPESDEADPLEAPPRP